MDYIYSYLPFITHLIGFIILDLFHYAILCLLFLKKFLALSNNEIACLY